MRVHLWFAVAILFLLLNADCASVPATATQGGTRVLVFSRTTGFRHDSIPNGIAAIRQLGQQNGFAVDATEDASQFTEANLARYQAVVFLSTTGDVLNAAQQAAFETYMRNGGGFAGVHSATDTEYDWPWYAGLVGAYFKSHPAIQRGVLRIEDATHPSTSPLPATWERTDEWYDFRINPRGRVKVLATLDESSYQGGTMGADHPIAWCQQYGGGRAWYTAGGHTQQSYTEALFRQHLLGGIQYAANLRPGACNAIGAASAASFRAEALAAESIASFFGSGLATATQAATERPLPTTLANTSVRVRDSAGIERLAPLFFVSPNQINLLLPAEIAAGAATFSIVKSDGTAPGGGLTIAPVAPAIFAANANGRGVPAGVLLVRRANAADQFLPIASLDAASNSFLPSAIDVSQANTSYFLVLFGTGLRGRSSLSGVRTQIGGVDAPVSFAGPQGDLAGLDQVNIEFPRTLAGRGDVEVALSVDGKSANPVMVRIR